ncbi:S41 family peptidase [Temperatibacter marinus]|uniref:Tricorn protease homolog n=1 Tax=Temperatibacter marinus TaxID=1456591 RepID=A0AA52H9C4_9PROT|nr:S41 family peptidase [Temperatibacter marinus]WND01493.1 S41 family peptidase [Temperatibacter marinus]
MKKILTSLSLAAILTTTTMSADTNSDWYRGAAISPDGKSILFQYKGDIFKVASKGGTAVPMTLHKAWDGHPVWSKDGKSIAFASDRFGNMDVFIMPANGGTAKRITHHSANDIPSDFSSDNQKILFSSTRQDAPKSVMGFTRASELYEISVSGGAPTMVLTTPASDAKYSKDDSHILYRGETGLEDPYRKHDTSSFTRDIWLYSKADGSHKRLTEEAVGDQDPVWGKNSKNFYYTSAKDGTFNIWKQDLDGKKKRLSSHENHAVRNLSRSKSGLMAYDHLGSLFTLKDGGKPKYVSVKIAADIAGSEEVKIPAAGMMSSFALSPNGKEIAFIARGDVYVTSTDYATSRRITQTGAQERSLSWGEDGKTLLYSSERGGKWRIYESRLTFEEEKYFFASTGTTERVLIDRPENEVGPGHAFRPVVSPDGKKVAFIGDRDTLMIFDDESKEIKTVIPRENTFHYTDGNIDFSWSPDSQWIAIEVQNNGRLFFPNIALVKADGSGDMADITQSGYSEYSPRWHSSGSIITWATARFGRRDHGSHGADFDIIAQFLDQESFDAFKASKEDTELAEDREKDMKEKESNSDNKKKEDTEKEETPKIDIQWENFEKRQARLTIHSGSLSSALLNKKATVLYYLMRGANGYDLWSHDLKKNSTSIMLPLKARSASMELSSDGKSLLVMANGRLSMVNLSSKKPKAVPVQATFLLHPAQERAEMFEHIWQQVADKFLKSVKPLHGANWDLMKAAYAPKIQSLNNNRDFAELMSEMLGELNASHTGARYRGPLSGDSTPSLGALFDPDKSKGLIIKHIFAEGPLAKADLNISVNDTITAINGTVLTAHVNPWGLLNNKTGHRVRLTIQKPAVGEALPEVRDIVMKPVSLGAEFSWRYERWVDRMEAMVQKLSGNRLAYVHLPFMADSVYRNTYSKLMGKHFTKEAVVVDSRWNRGGDLTNDLIVFLTGKRYMTNMPFGMKAQGEPLTRWTKPSILLMNEGNYSDGHCFPAAYSGINVGKTVGKQVPGTCSYVWWERTVSGDVIFGVPNLAILGPDGKTIMENDHLDPDVRVDLRPEDVLSGNDEQLKKAVELMLEQLDKGTK